MIAKEIISHIESFAPLALQESYDNSGLMVGNPSAEITGCLISLDITEEVVDEAKRNHCNMIIAHHPLIFGGLKKITGRNYVERTVIKAIKNDMLLYACHTNLDNVSGGVNRRIAETLGLTGLTILSAKKSVLSKLSIYSPIDHAEAVRQALYQAGAGNIGNYDECSFTYKGTGTFRPLNGANPASGTVGTRSTGEEEKIEVILPSYKFPEIFAAVRSVHPYEEIAYDLVGLENIDQSVGAGMVGTLEKPMKGIDFLEMVKEKMKAGVVRYTDLPDKKISKVAVCGGSGSFLLNDAIRAGADAFVTADFKYHQFFDADHRIVIADIGHFESEQFTVNLLAELVQKKFPTFAVRLSETRTNPIYYL